MRTPNTNCKICEKPLYRRPSDLLKYKEVCCVGCRSELYKRRTPSPNLVLGREKGTNHLSGIPKTQTHKNKMKGIMSKWCNDNLDKVKERGKKIRGENHYLWKGGTTILNQSIRRMTECIYWQRAVKKRDGKCMKCGKEKQLEAHHKKSLKEIIKEYNITNRDEARKCENLWDLNNGITLCRKCHYELENRTYNDNNN
jgi:5-methylcytosine-specific restriction endonuclease McrA